MYTDEHDKHDPAHPADTETFIGANVAGEEVEWFTEIEEKVLTRESDLT